MRSSILAALLLVLPGLLVATPSSSATTVNPGCYTQTYVDVMLVMDRSGSMVNNNRMVLAKAAAGDFLETLLPNDQSGLVSFSHTVAMNRNLTTTHLGAGSTNASVQALVPDGGTEIWKGIRMAHYELVNYGSFDPGTPYSNKAGLYGGKKVMVVLSDGDQNSPSPTPESEAAAAKANGITIFSIALGNGISPAGLQTMKDIATSPDHFFLVNNGDPLDVVFLAISVRMRDLHAPFVDLVRPAHRIYHNDVDLGASTLSLPAVKGTLLPLAIATDDCLIDHVEFTIDAYNDNGAFAGIVWAGNDTTAPYQGLFDCDALAGGRHTLRATAVDFDGKRASVTKDFYCVRAAIDSRSTALFTRLTNPVGPNATARGARLPTPLGGVDSAVVAHTHGTTPTPYDLSVLYDAVYGAKRNNTDATLNTTALSRIENLTLAAFPQHLELIETSAEAFVNAIPKPQTGFSLSTSGRAANLEAAGLANGASFPDASCTTAHLDRNNLFGSSVSTCPGDVVIVDNAEIRFGETIVRSGEGWRSITVNGIHVVVDRPEGRAELILAQSYAAASFLGRRGLAEAEPARATSGHDDAGRHQDAPGTAAAAWALAPGVYQGRIANRTDVDAYAFDVDIGEKLHVLLVPSHEVGATIHPGPSHTATNAIRRVSGQLLDPAFVVRDAKTSLAGEPVPLELNVDMAGRWTVLVSEGQLPGDYTMIATITPIAWPVQNDALLGVDAAGNCADAALVGPGVHLGALEPGETSDFFRIQVFEGQALVATLRPGDTADAADMDLFVYDPNCQLLAVGIPVGTVVKGRPEVVALGVTALSQPALDPGLYRAEVRYRNGVGSYQLALTTSVATQPT